MLTQVCSRCKKSKVLKAFGYPKRLYCNECKENDENRPLTVDQDNDPWKWQLTVPSMGSASSTGDSSFDTSSSNDTFPTSDDSFTGEGGDSGGGGADGDW